MANALDKRNLISAAVAVGLGIAVAAQGARYSLGNPTQMGPGFFPAAIGIAIVALGLLLAAASLRRPEAEAIVVDWRPLLLIPASLLVFALALNRLGLAPATLLLVAVASFAQPGIRPRLILGVTLFLVVATGLIFVYGLGMPVRLVAGSPL